MDQLPEFVQESDPQSPRAPRGTLTGWETVVFQLEEDEPVSGQETRTP